MEKRLAFVLGGGGARGAMQLGALRALFEAGFTPDLLVGTSIGAVNAAGLALWGTYPSGLSALERAWEEVAGSNLVDPRMARITLRALAGRPSHHANHRVKEFFISLGFSPSLRFNQVKGTRLGLVSSDLDSGEPLIYGQDPNQTLLEGLMASIALPPWFAPIEKDGRLLVDGGALSNLPIEPALIMGATEIIALDIDDPNKMMGNDHAVNQLLGKLFFSITHRQVHLETALAEAHGVRVNYISLRSSPPVPLWDFSNYRELIQIGYEITSQKILGWKPQ
jgi:NTE family protein